VFQLDRWHIAGGDAGDAGDANDAGGAGYAGGAAALMSRGRVAVCFPCMSALCNLVNLHTSDT
jgi:hypothetical protein